MSFPTSLLKSTWIPNNSLELFICSTSLLLLRLLPSTTMEDPLLLSLSLLAVSCADFNISLLNLLYLLVQLLPWLALCMQSPRLHFFSANG
jgi:hypothetical protein